MEVGGVISKTKRHCARVLGLGFRFGLGLGLDSAACYCHGAGLGWLLWRSFRNYSASGNYVAVAVALAASSGQAQCCKIMHR